MNWLKSKYYALQIVFAGAWVLQDPDMIRIGLENFFGVSLDQ